MPTDAMPTGPSEPLLGVRGVAVRYLPDDDDVAGGSTAAPEPRPAGVTFDVRPGEAVLLLGPSGCGKSTLALTLNGLVPHVVGAELEGTVLVQGRDTREARVPELAARVALVFQDPDAQVVTGRVLDEVCFGPENLLVPAPEVLARAESALRRVGLWERRDDDPARLSGGGRQRLAIACALALDAPLLVLDEPTANLDPAGVEEVYAALRDVLAAGDRGVLLVEHDVDAAVEVVDRVVVLDGAGRLVADGPAREVLTGRADELARLGVWLPTPVLVALRLRGAGVVLDPVPLTAAELTTALDAQPALPAPAAVLSAPAGVLRAGVLPAPAGPTPALRSSAVPALAVEGLSVRRGRTRVLHDVDLRVEPGELVAVVGPNGAGKTTLAQALAGVLPVRRGAVRVAGLDPARTDARTLATHVGFVFQNPEHQLVTTRVDDELAHGLRVRGVPEAGVTRRVDELLARLGLTELRAVHPFLLSGGQKRRLSVGTALVCRPQVLVLDEPTFGQDRERAAELLDLLAGLHRAGTTVVVVTHDLQVVAEHATRALVVVGGRVHADLTPARLLADDALLHAAHLRRPALAASTHALRRHPAWRTVSRLADVPAGAATHRARVAVADALPVPPDLLEHPLEVPA